MSRKNDWGILDCERPKFSAYTNHIGGDLGCVDIAPSWKVGRNLLVFSYHLETIP